MAFAFLLTYIGFLYLRPQEYLPALQGVPVMPVLFLASLAAWLFQPDKRLDVPKTGLVPAIVLAMVLSLVAAGWLGGIPPMLGDFLPIALLYFLVSSSTNTLARHHRFMAVLALCTVFLAVHGIDQVQQGIGWSGAELSQGTRITYLGIFNDPNDLALAFVIALPMLLHLMRSAKGFAGRMFWLAGTGTLLYGIFLTNSRGGMLSAAVQFLAFSVGRWGIVRSVIPMAIGVTGLAMLPSRLDNLDSDEASAEGRVEAWYSGIWMLIRHPIFGVGKGQFQEHHPLAAHNAYVLAFAELGLFGYFFWISFVALSVLMVWTASRAACPAGSDATGWAEHRAVARVYLIAMLGYLMGSFFLSRTYNPLLFMMCALCVGIFQVMRHRWPGFPRMAFGRRVVPLLALELGSIVFIFLAVRVLL